MRFRLIAITTMCVLLLSGCGNTVSRAVSIGDETYIMTTKAKPSPFGVAHAANMGGLIEEAAVICTDRGLRFELLERQENAGNNFKLGSGSITFKCVE